MASPYELALQALYPNSGGGWGAASPLGGIPALTPAPPGYSFAPVPDAARAFLSAPPGVPAGSFRTADTIYGAAAPDWLTGAALYDPATDQGDWLLLPGQRWWNRFTDATWNPGDPTPKGVNPQVSTTAKPGEPEPQVSTPAVPEPPATDFLSIVSRLASA